MTVATDAEVKAAQVARCLFDPAAPAETRTGEVVIHTDHPAQPVLKVAVFIAGPSPPATPGSAP